MKLGCLERVAICLGGMEDSDDRHNNKLFEIECGVDLMMNNI